MLNQRIGGLDDESSVFCPELHHEAKQPTNESSRGRRAAMDNAQRTAGPASG